MKTPLEDASPEELFTTAARKLATLPRQPGLRHCKLTTAEAVGIIYNDVLFRQTNAAEAVAREGVKANRTDREQWDLEYFAVMHTAATLCREALEAVIAGLGPATKEEATDAGDS